MKTQKGFTLIELIIVIVVLGILAVTAAPQFFNFSSDARESTVKGLEGSIKAAADIVYGKSAIEGEENLATAATSDNVNTVFGYPAASAAGIQAALNLSADWTAITPDAALETASASALTDGEGLLFHPTDYAPDSTDATTYGNTICGVYYQEAANAGARPTVTVLDQGC